jgi:hypothetical protein
LYYYYYYYYNYIINRQLQKQHLKHANSVSLRDTIRNEVMKQTVIDNEIRQVQEQQKMNISNYNNIINYNERESTKLRKRYDDSIKDRNNCGIRLITRNEEVCVIMERVNGQETLCKNGNIELQAREEEIRFLKMKIDEEKRQVELAKKQLPKEKALEVELENLRNQLIACQNVLVKLETKVEDSSDPNRIRFLDGPDQNIDDVMKKLEQLEEKLARVEEQSLEKDLILEQVNRLTERIQNKVATSKDDTLTLAKKVNTIQSQIKDVTRKMMAKVSELSIAQATALKLQEDSKTKELILQQSVARMDEGEAPNEDCEQEWLRTLLTQKRNRDKENNKQMVLILNFFIQIVNHFYFILFYFILF